LNPVLLLDLDNTLLQNNIDEFLPRYLKAFAGHVAGWIAPDIFGKSLLAGTQAMTQNRQPDCTLKEVFESVFYPLAGVDATLFQAEADLFYKNVFPTLRDLTRPISQAGELVGTAHTRGFNLAITTNPLFPRQAISQRLTWAELPVAEDQFRLITSYEAFHFAKPDPAFLAEVMGKLGWPGDPVIVVGDDYKRDILPARLLGLPAYWVNGKTDELEEMVDRSVRAGPLDELMNWMDHSPSEALQAEYGSSSSWMATLRATPAVLDSHCRSMENADWAERPAPGEWSLTEILCHLRDVDRDVNLPRLRKVIESDNPFIPGQDTDPWAEERRYRLQDGKQAYHQFLVARFKILDLLENLEPDGWQKPARHAIFGPTRLKELVNIIAAHDRLHLQQVFGLLEHFSPNLIEN
jgi:FMN phosphatase YigB (HAD superfamily)